MKVHPLRSKEKIALEHFEDITAEMRAFKNHPNAKKSVSGSFLTGLLCGLANRLDAAMNREREAARAYWTKKCRDTIAEHDRYCSPVGNAAALREALVSFMPLADYGVIQPRSVGEDDEYCFCVLKKMVRAALSAPARNCDRYKDAPSAYADFIVPWKLDGHLDDVPTLQDFANWLLAPAAERKGEEPCTRAMDATI